MNAPTLHLSNRSREYSVGELNSLVNTQKISMIPHSRKDELLDTKRFLDKLRHDKEARHAHI